jgi:hypothetical protein
LRLGEVRQQSRRLALGDQLARTLLGTQMQPLICATYAFGRRPLSRASRPFIRPIRDFLLGTADLGAIDFVDVMTRLRRLLSRFLI